MDKVFSGSLRHKKLQREVQFKIRASSVAKAFAVVYEHDGYRATLNFARSHWNRITATDEHKDMKPGVLYWRDGWSGEYQEMESK